MATPGGLKVSCSGGLRAELKPCSAKSTNGFIRRRKENGTSADQQPPGNNLCVFEAVMTMSRINSERPVAVRRGD
jgi:hypothetical protein